VSLFQHISYPCARTPTEAARSIGREYTIESVSQRHQGHSVFSPGVCCLPPSPYDGGGLGGGGEQSRSPHGLLPPIPAFPRAGGKGPKSPVLLAQYRELNGPAASRLPLFLYDLCPTLSEDRLHCTVDLIHTDTL